MNEDCHSVLSDGIGAIKEPENSQSLGEEGNSEPADAYEEAPIVEISRPKAYIQIFLVFASVCFGNLSYYTLTGLQTSLNGVLGSVATAIAYSSWMSASLFTQIMVTLLGLKVTIVLSHWVLGAYVLGFYYSTWPTQLIGSMLYGLAAGPVQTSAAIYANIIACSLAKVMKKDVKHYVGLFQGLSTTGALFSGAVIGNGASALIFLVDRAYSEGITNVTLTGNFNLSAVSNTSTNLEGCHLESTARTVSVRAYYILLGVATLSQITGGVLSLFVMRVKERSFTCMSGKKVWSLFSRSVIRTLKTFKVAKYMLLMMLALYTGTEAGYMLSVFAKYFVTDCIGIAFVGVAAMLYALFNAMSAVATGKIMVYTSRTVLSMCTMMWSTALCSFMLLWERQSSYAAAFVLAASIGVSNGSWTTLGAAYLGVVGQKKSEVVFGTYWAARGVGASAIFLLSISQSVVVTTSVLLANLVAAYVCYLIAETIYGEQLHKTCTSKLKTCFGPTASSKRQKMAIKHQNSSTSVVDLEPRAIYTADFDVLY
jgi:hypothetical protein